MFKLIIMSNSLRRLSKPTEPFSRKYKWNENKHPFRKVSLPISATFSVTDFSSTCKFYRHF